MKKYLTVFEGVFCMVSGAAIMMAASGMENNSNPGLAPGLFPMLFGGILIAFSAALLHRGIAEARREEAEPGRRGTARTGKRIIALVLFVNVLYVAALEYAGFLVSTVAFVFALMLILGEKRRLYLVVLPIASSGIAYVVFEIVFKVFLP